MKLYFKTVLPYLLMLFANYFVIKYAFKAMTAPHDLTFVLGVLALGALGVADLTFVVSQVKKIIAKGKQIAEKLSDTPSPDSQPPTVPQS